MRGLAETGGGLNQRQNSELGQPWSGSARYELEATRQTRGTEKLSICMRGSSEALLSGGEPGKEVVSGHYTSEVAHPAGREPG